MDSSYIHQYGELETTHWWFVVRSKIILQVLHKNLAKKEQLKILNIGAAGGASSKWLEAFGTVTSVENDPLFIDYLTIKKIAVTNASITSLPFADNSFDLVCAFDVVEHVEDDKNAVKEMFRVCKAEGNVCITVPAFQNLWGTHDEVNGHKRRYTTSQFQQLVNNKESKTIYTSYFNTILFLPVFMARKLSNLFKKNKRKASSDFAYFANNNFINAVFKKIFGLECYLLKIMRFPFGVSLIMLFEKNSYSSEKKLK